MDEDLTPPDELTGTWDRTFPWLSNESFLILRLDEEIKRASAYNLSVAALVIKLGARAGPIPIELARRLTSRLRSNVRSFDIVGVLDPEEFGFCLVHCDRNDATAIAERLVSVCTAMGVSARAGFAIFPGDDGTALLLLEAARSQAI
jgi:hypothetical protein